MPACLSVSLSILAFVLYLRPDPHSSSRPDIRPPQQPPQSLPPTKLVPQFCTCPRCSPGDPLLPALRGACPARIDTAQEKSSDMEARQGSPRKIFGLVSQESRPPVSVHSLYRPRRRPSRIYERLHGDQSLVLYPSSALSLFSCPTEKCQGPALFAL